MATETKDATPDTLPAEVALARKLYDDPKTRGRMQALIKEVAPGVMLPEHDAVQAVTPLITEIRGELAKEREERAKERQATARREAQQSLVSQGLASPDEIPAIEKLMVDEMIGSHAAAAKLFRATQQVAAPSTSASSQMQVPGLRGAGGDDFKGLVEDRDGWARSMAHAIVGDFQSGRGAKWL